jgi:hypothetical protein
MPVSSVQASTTLDQNHSPDIRPPSLAFSDRGYQKSRASAMKRSQPGQGDQMVAFLILLLILAVFGGLGFAAHFLWFVLIAALALWVIGFFVGGVESGLGRRRWFGRW